MSKSNNDSHASTYIKNRLAEIKKECGIVDEPKPIPSPWYRLDLWFKKVVQDYKDNKEASRGLFAGLSKEDEAAWRKQIEIEEKIIDKRMKRIKKYPHLSIKEIIAMEDNEHSR